MDFSAIWAELSNLITALMPFAVAALGYYALRGKRKADEATSLVQAAVKMAQQQQTTIEQLRAEIRQIQHDHAVQVAQLEAKIDALEAKSSRERGELVTQRQRVASLERDNARLTAENEALRTQVKRLEERIAELERVKNGTETGNQDN